MTVTVRNAMTRVQAGTRLRRARCLVCYWQDDHTLVAHRFPDGDPVALPATVVATLMAFDDWRAPAQVATSLRDHDQRAVFEAVEWLRGAGLLLAEHSERAALDQRVAEGWRGWAPQAPFLHYTTDVPTDVAPHGDDYPTPLFTNYPDADRMLLPRRPAALDVPFGRTLYERRTHYCFSPDSVPLDAFATLLHTVFGPVGFCDAGHSGPSIDAPARAPGHAKRRRRISRSTTSPT